MSEQQTQAAPAYFNFHKMTAEQLVNIIFNIGTISGVGANASQESNVLFGIAIRMLHSRIKSQTLLSEDAIYLPFENALADEAATHLDDMRLHDYNRKSSVPEDGAYIKGVYATGDLTKSLELVTGIVTSEFYPLLNAMLKVIVIESGAYVPLDMISHWCAGDVEEETYTKIKALIEKRRQEILDAEAAMQADVDTAVQAATEEVEPRAMKFDFTGGNDLAKQALESIQDLWRGLCERVIITGIPLVAEKLKYFSNNIELQKLTLTSVEEHVDSDGKKMLMSRVYASAEFTRKTDTEFGGIPTLPETEVENYCNVDVALCPSVIVKDDDDQTLSNLLMAIINLIEEKLTMEKRQQS